MKNKVSICVLLVIICFLSQSREKKELTIIEVEASWRSTYQTYQEMYDNADLIIVGRVSGQECIEENNIIFTHSTVDIDKVIKGKAKHEVIITQIGGVNNNLVTLSPEDAPLLTQGNCYYFFLMDGIYYSIVGGGQGAVVCSNVEEDMESVCSKALERSGRSTIETPFNGYAFTDRTNISYTLSSTSGVSGNVINAVKSGFSLWNGISSLSIYEANAGDAAYANVKAQFTISSSSLPGDTAGLTTKSGIYRYIYFYTDRMSQNVSDWKKLACHEMGHAVGLGHNYTGYSVMSSGLPYQASCPQYCDEISIIALYP